MTPAVQADPAYAAFNAPVALQTCRVELNSFPESDASAGTPIVAGVEVRFVNRSTVTATDVLFRIRVDYSTQIVDARGKFSPNVPINAIFYNFAGRDYFRPEPDICEPVEVRYADGTVWDAAPGPTPKSR